MTKELKEKAINIKGKQYVQVSDRILYFNETYRDGSITTDLVKYEDKQIIVKATIMPFAATDPLVVFTGYAQEIEGDGYINKTSALENAETSAVGRALAMMGIGVIDSIASIDEINKANNRPKETPPQAPKAESKPSKPIEDDITLNIACASTMAELTGIWTTLTEFDKERYGKTFTEKKLTLTNIKNK